MVDTCQAGSLANVSSLLPPPPPSAPAVAAAAAPPPPRPPPRHPPIHAPPLQHLVPACVMDGVDVWSDVRCAVRRQHLYSPRILSVGSSHVDENSYSYGHDDYIGTASLSPSLWFSLCLCLSLSLSPSLSLSLVAVGRFRPKQWTR
eukprot:2162740-Rhodomonas_salina.2